MTILPSFRERPRDRANPPLPRTITRSGWLGYQRAVRESVDRVASGLPHHPTNDLIDCPDCDGAGEHARNDTNPHGYGPDPQCDYTVPCARCNGTGRVEDGVIDLLVQLRRKRWWLKFPASPRASEYRYHYNSVRRRAVMPCSGLSAMEMRARAALCVNEAERAAAAWRRAAA